MKTKITRAFTMMSFLLTAAPAFFFTTYQLFLAERGMSIMQMSLINAAFMLSVFILEVPTGAFADSFGRRRSIVAGCLAWGISFFTYYFSDSLLAFILAEVIGALGCTLISGALEAWAVDSIDFHRVDLILEDLFHREERAKQTGAFIGSLLGAILGTHNLAWPWLFSGAGMFLAALAAHWFLTEPYFIRRHLHFSFKPLLITAQASWQAGRQNPAFLRIALISAALAMSVQALNMQWTLLFHKGFQLPIWGLGLIFGAIAITASLGARLAPLAAKKGRHEGQGLALAFLIIGIAMIVSGQVGAMLTAITFFLLHEVGRGLFNPLKKSIINRRIEGQNRATMLSLESMTSHAGAFCGLIGGGWLGNYYSISVAWAGSGIILLALVPWLWKKGV